MHTIPVKHCLKMGRERESEKRRERREQTIETRK